MECRDCGYVGEPEYGEYRDVETAIHVRCPNCKKTRHIIIETEERVKMAILYPEYCSGSPDWRASHGTGHKKTKKAISFLLGPGELDAYSIYCPVCEWGEGGGLPKDKVEELRKLFVEVNKP